MTTARMATRIFGPSMVGALTIAALVTIEPPHSVLAQAKPVAISPLPADLNQTSLRVNALSALYEFDLSPEQLRALKAAAVKTPSTQHRTAAKRSPELAQAFKDYQIALLQTRDDEAIAKAHNHVVELASNADLDDDVDPTDAARTQAPAICRRIKASQIAAFLAVHADEVADPVEMLLGAMDSIRDIRSDETAANTAASETEIGTLSAQTAESASYLVFGTDDAKAKPLAAKISAWLKSVSDLNEKDFTAQRAKLEDAAQKMIGDLDPMQVLSHWLNLRLAELLSNPELPAAIDATLTVAPAAK